MAPRFGVRLEDGNFQMVAFDLGTDDKGLPLYTSHLLEPVHISVYSQSEEARYANLLPGVGSVFAQDELSGGMGKKTQVRHEEPQFNHYYYADWFDLSVKGQGQKGPAVTTLTAPANSGPLSGSFVLGGVPYLVLGRRIASWASDALTAVHDYGAGISGGQAAVFSALAAEVATESNTTQTTTSTLTGLDDRLAQSFRMAGTGVRFLGSVALMLTRNGLAVPAAPVVTNGGTPGAVTWTYKISALSGGGETAVGAAGSTTTGAATLTSTNYNIITWPAIPGASAYKVYRTAVGTSPTSTGLIGTTLLNTFNDTGIAGDGSTPNATDTSGQILGDVRLSLEADLNGRPSGQIITSASMAALQIPMAATVMTFRFDDDATAALPYNVPFWLVLDCPGVSVASHLTLGWARTNNSDVYARGLAMASTDRGNTWANIATSSDFYFTVNAKAATPTAFVGTTTGGQFYKTTTNGSTFTADTYRLSGHFVVVNEFLVRSLGDGSASNDIGAIEWSTDGVNWNEDVITVGDPSVPITNLLTLGQTLIVCKEDGVFAVDLTASPISVQPLYMGARSSGNGVGACFWRDAVFIPFSARLMAIQGDVASGFVVYESVGIESMREWDWPWGAGRHVACVGTRHHLYSVVSAPSGYKLFKSSDPLRKKTDGGPDPEWHGSLATIGDGSQTVTALAAYDPGAAGSPQLFCTTTGNNVARVQLARTFNPAADPTYAYDVSTSADLYFSLANGSYPVHPKAWLLESQTFAQNRPGDYIDCLWDSRDGLGWRPLGRLYDTGTLPYPRGLTSQQLARRLRLTNSSSTASPLLLAHAVAYAMRHIKGAAMREITFTVLAEDGLSAADLGEMLGLGAQSTREFLTTAAGTGQGTRRMEDPYGRLYDKVLFLDATEVLQQAGQQTGGRTLIQVSAVGVG